MYGAILLSSDKVSLSVSVIKVSLVSFDFCFMALQHILGHFGRGQLT